MLQQAYECNCNIVCITVLPANGILSSLYHLLISLIIILIVQINKFVRFFLYKYTLVLSTTSYQHKFLIVTHWEVDSRFSHISFGIKIIFWQHFSIDLNTFLHTQVNWTFYFFTSIWSQGSLNAYRFLFFDFTILRHFSVNF